MLETVLPDWVHVVSAYHDKPEPLFPEEEQLIARAVPKRRNEFTTVRACARAALARLGIPPRPILPGLRGSPRWPEGVVGSMTHCDGYRAAAVAPEQDAVTIGVDAETHAPLPSGVLNLVALPEEQTDLTRLAAEHPAVCWDRLLFSAKESIYKAWFPLTQRWLDFHQARVTVDPDGQGFTARLLVDSGVKVNGEPLTGFTGHWVVRDGLVATAIAVPRSA